MKKIVLSAENQAEVTYDIYQRISSIEKSGKYHSYVYNFGKPGPGQTIDCNPKTLMGKFTNPEIVAEDDGSITINLKTSKTSASIEIGIGDEVQLEGQSFVVLHKKDGLIRFSKLSGSIAPVYRTKVEA